MHILTQIKEAKENWSYTCYLPPDWEGFSQPVLIDLFNVINIGQRTNFRSKLIELIMKADRENRAKLSSVYPEECFAVWAWNSGYLQINPEEP